MLSLRDADVVLALGTRLSPFGTLPQYGIDYWPKDAKARCMNRNKRNPDTAHNLVQSMSMMSSP